MECGGTGVYNFLGTRRCQFAACRTRFSEHHRGHYTDCRGFGHALGKGRMGGL